MSWQTIGQLTIVQNWVVTDPIWGALFRIKSLTPQADFKGLVAQAYLNDDDGLTTFDARRFVHRPNAEGFVFIKPEGIQARRLAFRRVDSLQNNWIIQVEVANDVPAEINLPIQLNDVTGLLEALNNRATVDHTHNLENVMGLAPILGEIMARLTILEERLAPEPEPEITLESEVANFQALISESGNSIKVTSLNAVNEFVKGLKNDGIWNLLVDCWVAVGDSLETCLIKLKHPQNSPAYLINHNFTSNDYIENIGLTGDGISKYLDTGFILADQSQQGAINLSSCGLCVYITQGNPSDQSTQIGGQWWIIAQHYMNEKTYYSRNIGGNGDNAGHAVYEEVTSEAIGFFSFSHINQTAKFYKNGNLAQSQSIGNCIDDANSIYILARNRIDLPQYSPRTTSFYAIKKGMTAAQELALYDRVQALQEALGRAV